MSDNDLIRRMDAMQACQIGPPDEWARSTKDGYNQAATDCAMNILKIAPATVTPQEAARVLADWIDSDMVTVNRMINAMKDVSLQMPAKHWLAQCVRALAGDKT